MASANLRHALETHITIREKSFHRLLSALDDERRDLTERFREAKNDEAYLEMLEAESADLNQWSIEIAELVIVAVYHWVERELKVLATWLPGDPPIRSDRMDLRSIIRAFKNVGFEVEAAASFAEIDLLREFANAWKHNPFRPSPRLSEKLQLDAGSREHGLLSNPDFERSIRRVLGVSRRNATPSDVATAAINHARGFLIGLVRTVPIRQ
jgi:hypothetical protein